MVRIRACLTSSCIRMYFYVFLNPSAIIEVSFLDPRTSVFSVSLLLPSFNYVKTSYSLRLSFSFHE